METRNINSDLLKLISFKNNIDKALREKDIPEIRKLANVIRNFYENKSDSEDEFDFIDSDEEKNVDKYFESEKLEIENVHLYNKKPKILHKYNTRFNYKQRRQHQILF